MEKYIQNNLTALYRPNSLDKVLGQEMNIKFLKNSLFKNLIYPVYIFSGQRGTGKTSTARIFALSYLCNNYDNFISSNGKEIIPCQKCSSCNAFFNNKHPDIIELDAASNNGVDTIRAIIDSASLLPLIGNRKFYIIDEVHMLSKAAFNACLKIMEEPPSHVTFILATTEFHKIIDTIKSRGITLNFKPINSEIIYENLLDLSKKENIKIDNDSLVLISKISDGSMRDALNYLERLRMTADEITLDLINSEIGRSDNILIESFLESIKTKNEDEYNKFKSIFLLNNRCQRQFWISSVNFISEKIKSRDLSFLKILKIFYKYEQTFFYTSNPSGILDIIFYESISDEKISSFEKKPEKIKLEIKNDSFEENLISKEEPKNELEIFIELSIEKDKAIGSIFKQGKISIDHEKKEILCSFKECFKFYKDFINEKISTINDIVYKSFGNDFNLKVTFEQQNEISNESKLEINKNLTSSETKKENLFIEKSSSIQNRTFNNFINKKNIEKRKLNKNDAGPFATKIMAAFPGTTYYME